MAKKSLKQKKSSPIETGKFSLEESKMYLAAGIICFHILPLFFVFWGETGQQLLLQFFLVTINPILLFAVCCFHGCRLGFCVKFPLITGILAAASILMYYDGIQSDMRLAAAALFLIVYLIFTFASEALGGFLKHLIGGY